MHFGHLEPRVEGCLQTHNFTKQNSDKSYSTEKLHLKVLFLTIPNAFTAYTRLAFQKK